MLACPMTCISLPSGFVCLGNMASGYLQLGKSKRDVASSLECYMKEHGMAVEDAMAALAAMVEQAGRRINQACMELGRGLLPAAQLVVNMTRMLEVYYLHGRDGLTYGRELKELITFLFLKQVPV
ncbi:beta-cubebene synthase [Setaria italica]|uniref:beta-cubebene synthase n=1 Tax=Setaria italica TaxID=4555 RepID=UPI000350B20E|nr:beta-cubebene synthase [Setaria italica]XP_034594353.1 eudesmanediol synthase-like [Setaria viridis]